MTAKVFIDGEVGTTGLQIRARLERRADVELLSLPETTRKDPGARAEMLNAADLAILCLPDAAAREAVAMIENPDLRVIDASTAHRSDAEWVYGLPATGKDDPNDGITEENLATKVGNMIKITPSDQVCNSARLPRKLVSGSAPFSELLKQHDQPCTISSSCCTHDRQVDSGWRYSLRHSRKYEIDT